MSKLVVWVMAVSACASLACGSASSESTGEGLPPAGNTSSESLYLVSTNLVGADDSREGLLFTVPSIEAGTTIDYDKAVAPGGSLATYGVPGKGWFIVGSGDEPTFTRWEARSDGSLVPGERVSFANYGVDSTVVSVQNAPFISDTKAYLFADTREIIVWNPSDMSVRGTIDLGLQNRGDLTPSTGLGMLQRDDRVLMVVFWKSADSTQFGDSGQLIEVDTTTDSIVSRTDSPLCDDLFVPALAPDGSAYFSNHPYRAALRKLRGTTYGSRVCALRVGSSGSGFDAAFNPDLRALAEGREAGQFIPLSNTVAAFRAFYPEEAGDPAEYKFSTPAYRWWRWEIGSPTASVIPEQTLSGAGAGIHYDGTRVYVTTGAADFASTTLTELTSTGTLKEGLQVRGAFHGFLRLR